MFQTHKQKEELKQAKNAILQKIVNTPVKQEEKTRKVILWAKTGCGCGGSTTKVERIVPIDSPLKDGDDIGWDILDTDKVL